MSDNMEHIADFFRESGHRDRHFEVNEAGWDRLATALDEKKKRRWLPFWWRLGIFLLAGVGLAFWLTIPTNDTTISLTTEPVEIQPNTERSAPNGSNEQPKVQAADQEVLTYQAEHQPIGKPARLTTSADPEPVRPIEREERMAVKTHQETAKVPTSAAKPTPIAPVGPAIDSKSPVAVGEGLAKKVEINLGLSGVSTVSTAAEVLPATGEEPLFATSLQSITSVSEVNRVRKPKQASRQPYPSSKVYQQTARPTTTRQTMLGAPVYGSTIRGEEINAWESDQIGGRWQVALGVGTIPAKYQGVLFYYSTEQIPAVFTTEYTMADGSVIDLYADGNNRALGQVPQNFNFYRLALYRDLGKGFGVKGSLLIATINDRTPASLLNQVPNRPDIAYFTNNNRSTNIIAELGLQYTFYRRQRFQPFLGLSVFNVMASSFRSEQRFVWPGMGINEVSTSSSSFSRTNFPGYYFEVGMQYLPAPDWSIGPSLIITGTPFVEPQLGFGIEARYRF